MKKRIFIVIVGTIVALTGCGNKEMVKEQGQSIKDQIIQEDTVEQTEEDTADQTKEDESDQLEVAEQMTQDQSARLDKLEEENSALRTRVEALEGEVETLKNNEAALENKVENSNSEDPQVETNAVPQQETDIVSQAQGTIEAVAEYHGKLFTLKMQMKEEAENNPQVIYDGVACRDICLLIYKISVKNVYVNQSLVKEKNITYDKEKGAYRIKYHMNGGGEYMFRIVSEDGREYYINVNYTSDGYFD